MCVTTIPVFPNSSSNPPLLNLVIKCIFLKDLFNLFGRERAHMQMSGGAEGGDLKQISTSAELTGGLISMMLRS